MKTPWIPVLGALLALAACGPPTADVAQTFAVAHSTPHHGAVDVATDVVPLLAFTAAVEPSTAEFVVLSQRENGESSAIEVTRFVGDEGVTVRLVPRRALDANAEFVLEVVEGLESVDGAILGAPYRSSFFTAAD